MNYQEIIKTLNEIAIQAGDKILDIYNNEEDFNIESKSDDSPLTKADKSANDVICAGLIKLTPNIPIISEENKEIAYSERKSFTQAWLVDPLDGTKEFIKRNGEFTVNIALIENNEITMGVFYAPILNELYFAYKGSGAFLTNLSTNETKQIQAPTFSLSDEGLKLVCSRSHLNDETKNYLEQFNNPELVSKGSSLKFLMVAKGDAHIYPRLAPTMEWDTGAAQIIVEEAGGTIINHETNSKLLYNKENLRNPYFIASGNIK